MTTTRIVRGTKGRIFLYVCGVLILTGILACYNSARNQLEDLQKTNDLCRQQQEHLTSQLQVIFDYKQRLEKSLKSEKSDHEQLKSDLENKLKDEHEEYEKQVNENKLRFTSLQQQYKLLERQFDDFKEESSKIQSKQLNEINRLQVQLNKLMKVKESLQLELKMSESDKAMKDKHLIELHNELNIFKKAKTQDDIQQMNTMPVNRKEEAHDINFSKQKSDGNNAYEIQTHEGHNKTNLNETGAKKNEDNVYLFTNRISTSTSSSRRKSSNFEPAPLMPALPTVTPESKIRNATSKTSLNVLPVPNKSRHIPNGFVPIFSKQLQSKEYERNMNDLPARYGNKILDDENIILNRDSSILKHQEIDDKENGANEIETVNDKDENQLDKKIENLQKQIKLHIDHLQQPDEQEPEDPADEDEDAEYFDKKDPAVRN